VTKIWSLRNVPEVAQTKNAFSRPFGLFLKNCATFHSKNLVTLLACQLRFRFLMEKALIDSSYQPSSKIKCWPLAFG